MDKLTGVEGSVRPQVEIDFSAKKITKWKDVQPVVFNSSEEVIHSNGYKVRAISKMEEGGEYFLIGKFISSKSNDIEKIGIFLCIDGDSGHSSKLGGFNFATGDILIPKNTWKSILPEGTEESRKVMSLYQDHPKIGRQMRAMLEQDDEFIFRRYLFSFHTNIAHENCHKKFFESDASTQRRLADALVEASDRDEKVKKSIDEFVTELYSLPKYLQEHQVIDKNNNPGKLYKDDGKKVCGILDSRTLEIEISVGKMSVSLPLLVSEIYSGMANRVLLEFMIKRGDKYGNKFSEFFSQFEKGEIEEITFAARKMYTALKESKYFDKRFLESLYPEDELAEILDSSSEQIEAVRSLQR